MRWTRIVTQGSSLEVNSKTLRRLQILIWRDPEGDAQLAAMSHQGRICPLIRLWRQRFDRSQI